MSDGVMTLYIATSVDGFIAATDGSVSWLEEYQQETEGDDDTEGYEEFFDTVDCLLMGSKTYEQVLRFGEWPYGEKPTFVVTQRDLPIVTDSVTLFDGEIENLGRELKQEYNHVWLVGGGKLARTFLKYNQVNRIHLSLIPVLLGSGIELFDDTIGTHQLSLDTVTSPGSGIAELQYSVNSS